jgi:hypothetical protein
MAKKRKRTSGASVPPQPVGRPTTLTKELQDKIVAAVAEGDYLSVACELVGVPGATGRSWKHQGSGKRRDRPANEEFAAFATAVEKAKAEAAHARVQRITEAAQGRRIIRQKTVTKISRDAEGNEETETITEIVETTNYDWRADAWMLEHQYPDLWGSQRMSELEAWKVLIEAGQVPDEVIDAILVGEEERRSRIQAALKEPQESGSEGM